MGSTRARPRAARRCGRQRTRQGRRAGRADTAQTLRGRHVATRRTLRGACGGTRSQSSLPTCDCSPATATTLTDCNTQPTTGGMKHRGGYVHQTPCTLMTQIGQSHSRRHACKEIPRLDKPHCCRVECIPHTSAYMYHSFMHGMHACGGQGCAPACRRSSLAPSAGTTPRGAPPPRTAAHRTPAGWPGPRLHSAAAAGTASARTRA